MPHVGPQIQSTRPAEESRFTRAHDLAREIQELLGEATPEELEGTGYGVRLALGLVGSLVDQLEELERGPSPSRRSSIVAAVPRREIA